MTSYFNDVAGYQTDTVAYFKGLKARGSRGVVVKTTQGGIGGTPYINPRGHAQVVNAQKAGLKVALYHYGTFNSLRYGTGDPASEAKLMANTAKAWGCGTDTIMVLDAEDPALRTKASADAALFYNELKRHGYHNFDIYGPGSWFWAGRLKIGTGYKLGGWPAAYNNSGSGVTGAKAWQYTDNWMGLGVDGSLDYGGQYTTGTKVVEQNPTPKNITDKNVDDYYFCYNPGRIIVQRTIYQHKTTKLSSTKNRGNKLAAGTPVDIAKVHFDKKGIIPYFELANGTYITANRYFVTNAYYELPNLKQIKVLKATYLYHDLNRTKIVRRDKHTLKASKWPKGTYFNIKKVIKVGTIWILKTDSDYYMTAYKQYVKKTK